MKQPLRIAAALVLVVGMMISAAMASPAEHPADAEQPAEDAGAAGPSSVSMDDLADAITSHVKQKSAESGYFTVVDETTGETLELELVRVHRDKLSQVGDQEYFACADFKARDGITYDIDVFMSGADKASLEPTQVSIHKQDGTERYTWREEDGRWTKVVAEESQE